MPDVASGNEGDCDRESVQTSCWLSLQQQPLISNKNTSSNVAVQTSLQRRDNVVDIGVGDALCSDWSLLDMLSSPSSSQQSVMLKVSSMTQTSIDAKCITTDANNSINDVALCNTETQTMHNHASLYLSSITTTSTVVDILDEDNSHTFYEDNDSMGKLYHVLCDDASVQTVNDCSDVGVQTFFNYFNTGELFTSIAEAHSSIDTTEDNTMNDCFLLGNTDTSDIVYCGGINDRTTKNTLDRKGKASYTCECGATYVKQSQLQRHIMAAHTYERPFRCDYETCKWAGVTLSALNKHRISHSIERPYYCIHCNATFKTKQGIKRHHITHRDNRPVKAFVCRFPRCQKGYSRQYLLRDHLRKQYAAGTHDFDAEISRLSIAITRDSITEDEVHRLRKALKDIGSLKDLLRSSNVL